MSEFELDSRTIKELIDYNPHTGKCVWKERGEKWFSGSIQTASHSKNSWNTKNCGNIIKTKHKTGFLYTAIFGKKYKLHRLIWLYMTDEWPHVIDHIDGNPSNNKWNNLRNVDQSENMKNISKSVKNTSGIIGVGYDISRNKWCAKINNLNRTVNLGRFDKIEDAIKARKEAEIKYGFHTNHGRE